MGMTGFMWQRVVRQPQLGGDKRWIARAKLLRVKTKKWRQRIACHGKAWFGLRYNRLIEVSLCFIEDLSRFSYLLALLIRQIHKHELFAFLFCCCNLLL
jgi:hypothetical protein